MAKVQIFRGEHLEQELPIGAGTVVLGRSAENGLVLDHPSISRKHATLSLEGGRIVLRDAGSTNGLYVGKQRVDCWDVVEGEAAELGVFTLRVIELASAAPPAREEEQRTRIITRSVERPVIEAPEAPAPAAVLVASGPGDAARKYSLTGQALTVGRGKECDICFDDRMVSRLHARVFSDGGIWKISDMESVNGIFVNGVRVKEAVLAPGQAVTVGSCTLVLASGEKPGTPDFGLRGRFSPRKPPSRKTAIVAGAALVLVLGGVAALGLRGSKEPDPVSMAVPGPPATGSRSPARAPEQSPQPPRQPPAPASTAAESAPAEGAGSRPAGQERSVQTAVAPIVVPRIPAAPATVDEQRRSAPEPPTAAKTSAAGKTAGEEKNKARLNILNNAERAAAEGDCSKVRTSARAMEALDPGAATREAMASRKLLDACDAKEQVRLVLAEATAAERAGDWGKARNSYQKAVALDPGNPEAKRGLDAIAAAEGGRKSRIKDCFQKAEIFESIGELRDAIRLWQEVVTLAPDPADPDHRNAMGKIEKYKGIAR